MILVAGNSTRYGQNRNKNFEKIKGKAVMTYSLMAFQENSYVDNIIIGAKEEELSTIKEMISQEVITKPIEIVIGGRERQETVHHCITKTKSDIVIIHDGARPAIKQEYINRMHRRNEEF